MEAIAYSPFFKIDCKINFKANENGKANNERNSLEETSVDRIVAGLSKYGSTIVESRSPPICASIVPSP